MATESERPIEKLLRASAQRRREEAGAPLELHPATRRLLQGEVTRQFGKPQTRTEPFWLALTRIGPKLAWGAGVVCMVAVLAMLLFPGVHKSRQEPLLAKNEPATEPQPMNLLTPEPGSSSEAAAPASALGMNPAVSADADKAAVVRDKAPIPAEPKRRERAKEHTAEMARSTAARLPAPASPAPSRPMAKAEGATGVSGKENLRVQAAPAEAAAFQQRYGLARGGAESAGGAMASAPAPSATAPVAHVGVMNAQTVERFGTTAGTAAPRMLADSALAGATPANAPADALAVSKFTTNSVAAGSKQGNQPGLSQRFQQVPMKAKLGFVERAAPTQVVLGSFQVEQTGQALRIVDNDGSVYQGSLQPAESLRRVRAGLGSEAAGLGRPVQLASPKAEIRKLAAPEVEAQAGQNYAFRVTGTNRSLNQQVVFTGNLTTATNLLLSARPTNVLGQAMAGGQASTVQQSTVSQNRQSWLLDMRISGKAVIDGRQEVEINALATGP